MTAAAGTRGVPYAPLVTHAVLNVLGDANRSRGPRPTKEEDGADAVAREAKDTRWGVPLDDWARAREQVRAALVHCAEERGCVTYTGLCEAITAARLRPYSWALMALLDEACREEDAVHGVMTASLVVRRDSGRPGGGYFAWAERAGLDVSDREAFWRAQAERVWSAYER